ncbi:cytochrome c oxidase subunit 3 [Aurantiacibacter spongiae]|uniref:Cytochrome bo(3) ubiquinol oxidase subunit 3 n=1 Tax=Aurantiacibacter spongiae TaxID=2488860 RepID=A0A3N5DRH9_9SPHN|nr:cytochrome c oxidase subunit 3 [Aurantiacibacter spongiae]RPF71781.1 cytochrome o ubiquinol oxidase subunit III [Aurantiacibacter spongiae]
MNDNVARHPGVAAESSHPEVHRKPEPVMFGFWVFLMSDLVLFAVLLATYATMSVHGVAGGPAPRDVTDLASAAIETALLLASSFTFGLASLAQKYEQDPRQTVRWLLVTAALGLAFLGLEARDFVRLVADGAVPQRSGFLSAHFTLLACHGLHVAAGLLWVGVLLMRMRVGRLQQVVRLRIMRLALFWHMLDIVWVAIVTVAFLFGAV